MSDGSHIVTRRAFAATSLVAGFALAAGPLRAGAIVTDANGLVSGAVKIAVGDGTIPGFRARPVAGAHWPVVLVTQEIFGVHEHIRDICRRFAKLGCYAIAPSLFARYGDPGQYSDIHKLVADIVSKAPDTQVMSDLDAAARFAVAEGADPARLSIVGFCWGGRIVWLYAAHNPALRAAAAFYGALRAPSPRNPLRPLYPLDLAANINAPVIAFYGAKDDGIPVADVEAMRAALAQAGKRDWHIDVFMDTGHGFFADYRPTYNEADAKLAWSRTLDWFKQHRAM
jgi:carboxymethylenebutenolidase